MAGETIVHVITQEVEGAGHIDLNVLSIDCFSECFIHKVGLMTNRAAVGVEQSWHKRWWPMYHKTIDAGKKLFIRCDTIENLKALKGEFSQGLNQFIIEMGAGSRKQAEEILKLVSD